MQRKSNYLKKAVTAVCMSALAVCAASVVANLSTIEVSAAKNSRYQLVWSDEFNGTELNTENWTYEIGNSGSDGNNPGWGNKELEYYTDRPENISVSNGTLKITAIEEKYEGCNYTSARIKTADKQSFRYGKLEARMKLPMVDGVWPAFWMMGYNEKGWPYCGEIDIMEAWNTGQFAQGAYHWYNELGTGVLGGAQYRWRQMNNIMNDFKGFDKSQWHTYAVEWDENEIKWLVDDKEYYTLDITSKDKSEAHGLYYFILNVAVGGTLPAMAPVSGTLPATAEVDYVRAYQLSTNPASYYSGTWKEQSQVPSFTATVKNGSKIVSATQMYDGETLVLPELKKKGYTFKGYYTKAGKKVTADTRIRANTAVNGKVEISAKWTKVKVKKAVISKLTSGKKVAKLKFKKISGVKGYQVKYSQKKSVKGGKTTSIEGRSIAIPKLKSGKVYYFKARAYKFDSRNKKVYGKWSKVKSIVVK